MMKLLRFAVVGHPVAHSASPAMHNAAFRALELPYRYDPLDAKDRAALSSVLSAMRKGVVAGINVTTPHKAALLELVDRRDPLVDELGAANTVVRHFDGGLVAYNTDAPALVDEIGALQTEKRVAVILGAGGAARAAMYACKQLQFRVIVVTTRSWSTSEALYDSPSAEWFRKEGAMTVLWPTPTGGTTSHLSSAIRLQWWDLAQGADLVIHATSAGGEGGAGGIAVAAAVPWDKLSKTAVALDLRYGAVETPFLQAARKVGLRAVDGVGMLVNQGARSFELWHMDKAPRGAMELAAREYIQGLATPGT
jgi:shikimate dehydrogenase